MWNAWGVNWIALSIMKILAVTSGSADFIKLGFAADAAAVALMIKGWLPEVRSSFSNQFELCPNQLQYVSPVIALQLSTAPVIWTVQAFPRHVWPRDARPRHARVCMTVRGIAVFGRRLDQTARGLRERVGTSESHDEGRKGPSAI